MFCKTPKKKKKIKNFEFNILKKKKKKEKEKLSSHFFSISIKNLFGFLTLSTDHKLKNFDQTLLLKQIVLNSLDATNSFVNEKQKHL